MRSIHHTRNLFLRGMSIIYLFAFSSLYIQIKGLYGKNGLLPAHIQLESEDNNLVHNIHNKPTLLWLAPYVGLDTEYMMDVLALIGVFLSLSGFWTQKCCCKPMFAALWSLYYSLFQVGQTFLWFQWDILLLEVGFLCIILAPLRFKPSTKRFPVPEGPAEPLIFFLVRWLLFRLMFSTGVVKLTSGCPQWWGLTALKVHFESMCLPAPLAWYCFHLPEWFLKLTTVFANVCEIFIPPFFLCPNQPVKTIAFFIQVFLQLCIIFTGNFNFLNFLTITLCISLLNDSFLLGTQEISQQKSRMVIYICCLLIYWAIGYTAYTLYSLKIVDGTWVDAKIAFTQQHVDKALTKFMPLFIGIGAANVGWLSLKALFCSLVEASSSMFSKILTILSTIFYILVAVFIFSDSLVPFSTLNPKGNLTVMPLVREWHTKLSHLHLTNSYGLFRRMTGVGGRPEIIIEGSNDLRGPWLEYPFLYKPGEINRTLPYVAPHQPRLDWQMWFAALGTYHQNPWLMSLAYRILTNQKEVLALMDYKNNPFPEQPPKYLRANLYHYHFTSWMQRHTDFWWTRKMVGEYFPVFTKDHKPLIEYLEKMKILSHKPQKETVNPQVKYVLECMRNVTTMLLPEFFVWALLSSAITIMLFSATKIYPPPPPRHGGRK